MKKRGLKLILAMGLLLAVGCSGPTVNVPPDYDHDVTINTVYGFYWRSLVGFGGTNDNKVSGGGEASGIPLK
jgi:hypothetical protein